MFNCKKIFKVSTLHQFLNVLPKSCCNSILQIKSFHTTTVANKSGCPGQHKRILAHSELASDTWGTDLGTWTDNNHIIYKPMKNDSDGQVRPAELYYGRSLIRHSPKKLWYLTKVILHKNIDEAIAQLNTINYYKGAEIVADILKDAKEVAAKEHYVEYPSNMHIVSANVLSSGSRKIPRYHAKLRINLNHSYFANFYVLLREGEISDMAKTKKDVTALDMALDILDEMRHRDIVGGL